MGCKQQIALACQEIPKAALSFLQKEKHSKSAHLPIDAYLKTAAHIVTCVGHRRLTESCWGLSILAGGLFLEIPSRSLRLLDLFYSVGDRCVDYGEITKRWKRGAADDFEICEDLIVRL